MSRLTSKCSARSYIRTRDRKGGHHCPTRLGQESACLSTEPCHRFARFPNARSYPLLVKQRLRACWCAIGSSMRYYHNTLRQALMKAPLTIRSHGITAELSATQVKKIAQAIVCEAKPAPAFLSAQIRERMGSLAGTGTGQCWPHEKIKQARKHV